MGYLGTKPANQITDSTLIADGTITTSDLASGLTVNFADGSASTPSITNDGDTNTGIFFPAADTIAFAEGGAEIARFDSSGNLGIGTSSPSYRLQVSSSGDCTAAIVSTSNGAGLLRLAGSDNSAFSAYNAVQSLNTNGSQQWYLGGDGVANTLVFKTGTSERMRLDSSGRLLVGTTTPTDTGATVGIVPSGTNYALTVRANQTTGSNQIVFFNPNGAVGFITTSGSSTSYVTSSDYRLKNNIAPMTGALATVSALKPVTYTWKADGSDGQGFIAHELQAVVPDCVSGEKDAVETYTDEDGVEHTRPKYQGIDTSFLVATLTAAIQEQQAIITDLKARIETLENK